MDITWLGDYSFRINDEIINVIVNPTDKTIDSSLLTDETVIINTDPFYDYETKLSKVESPGEYEINNVSIHGVANSVLKDQDRSIST